MWIIYLVVAVTSEGTEDIDILGDEYTENREENEIMDFDNMSMFIHIRWILSSRKICIISQNSDRTHCSG